MIYQQIELKLILSEDYINIIVKETDKTEIPIKIINFKFILLVLAKI